MKSIADLMTREPIVVPISNEIPKTIDTFLEIGMTSAPVVDNFGKLAGMITEMNLITAFFRIQTRKDGKDKIVYHADLLEPVETVRDTDTLSETVKRMVRAKHHRVVVLDKHDRVVGIISPKDVLKAVTGNQGKLTRSQKELQEARDHVKKVTSELETAHQMVNRLEGYLHEAPYMIHSVDARGKILMMNSRMETALGYARGALIGKGLDELYTIDFVDEAKAGLRQIVQEGHLDPVVTSVKKKNGDAFRIETVSTALHNQKGEFVATITMSRPVGHDMLSTLADAFSEPPPLTGRVG